MTSPEPDTHAAELFEYAARCRIIRKVADGGMGSVFLAEQIGETGFAKTVAVKVIRKNQIQDPLVLQMFIDEAKLTADLVHQNILQVYNLARFRGRYFIVMEYLHGVTATQFLARHRQIKRLPSADISAFIVSRVCRGLAYAHGKRDRRGQPLGIVHRDVTPSNIMMDYRGFCKLSDFGIAKALTVNMPDESEVIMGKLPYMSPEQARGEVTDARSDLFSLGLVLYEMLTGQRVYQPRTRKELIEMLSRFRIKDPRLLRDSISSDLVGILMKAVEKDRDKRFQGAKEFGDALEFYMYHDRYGPTNEKLADYLLKLFPEADPHRIE